MDRSPFSLFPLFGLFSILYPLVEYFLVSGDASSSETSFKIPGGITSWPAALWGSIICMALTTSFLSIGLDQSDFGVYLEPITLTLE